MAAGPRRLIDEFYAVNRIFRFVLMPSLCGLPYSEANAPTAEVEHIYEK